MRDGWQAKPLDEVCTIRPPKKESKELLDETALVSFVPMNNLGIEEKYFSQSEERLLNKVYSGYTYFKDNDVLLAKITPCFENGKLGIAKGLTNKVGFGSSEFIVYRPKQELLSEYLYYFLNQQSFRTLGTAMMTGAVGHKRIPKEFYEKQSIPIPPITEQKEIVAILDDVFEGIEKARANLEKNIENTKELFQSKLNEIFSQKGDSWKEEKMVNTCSIITCGVAAKPTYVDAEIGVPFLSAQNVKNGQVTLHAYKHISREFHEKLTKKNKPTKGDILYSRVGAKYGEAAVFEEDFEFSVYVSLTLIRPIPEKLDNYYFKYYLNSPLIKALAKSSIQSSGVPNLNVKTVRDFPVHYPSLNEQKTIVNSIIDLEDLHIKLLEKYETSLSHLDELKKSILQKAFTGELTSKDIPA